MYMYIYAYIYRYTYIFLQNTYMCIRICKLAFNSYLIGFRSMRNKKRCNIMQHPATLCNTPPHTSWSA